MTPDPESGGPPGPPDELLISRLLPAGGAVGIEAAVEGLHTRALPPAPEWRPRVLLNMVSTADGRATLGGRSGAISDRADRELFHGLRGMVDAVMAGAGTVRTERYGRIIPSEERRRERLAHGLSEEPLACIVSGRLALEPDIPLLADPHARVAIVTSSPASLPASGRPQAQIDYVRAEREGRLDLRAALAELRERFAVTSLLCEGGPHLNAELLRAGLVDELFLSLAPKLAGGDTADGQASLRILAGPPLEAPLELELLGVLESDSELFLRYGVGSPTASSPARV